MSSKKIRLGFALTGSMCTLESVIEELKKLAEIYDIIPIMSPVASTADSRYGLASTFTEAVRTICGKDIITTIEGAEPIGPMKLLDVLVIAPCTGNTIAKIANGITDTCVTLAYKAHMRNGGPVVIAVSTNDGLSANAVNIGRLLERKNVYLVPYGQDNPTGKPTSPVADFSKIGATIEAALNGRQLQPLLI
ncbi:MAG: dipicolinate synthase subunit B [Papillibacter sp.]|nr:dipicolinate synthase subunit B [Papillibacter sp.]